MDDQVAAVMALPDPLARAKAAGDVAAMFQESITELSRIRREALDNVVAQGMTHAQIAEALGMTRSRVGQLLSSGPKVERIFLGTGTLTIAVGGKLEAKDENPGPVVAQEDFYAYEQLQSLAKTLSLATDFEVIPPPGILNLNRDNLIVICGPRVSPLVGQVLASDDDLGFEVDNQGWHLVDNARGETYRSPMDSGQNRDFAYFGRLPRLDGKGTFMYIAGIHAVGASGVVHYLDGHIVELYKELKTQRFSTIIECEFDENRKIIRSSRTSPLYRQGGEA
jgi:hypothetical protein